MYVIPGQLPCVDVAYETWGELNETKSNAILLCTGLSASSHAKSHPVSDRSRHVTTLLCDVFAMLNACMPTLVTTPV